MNGHVLARLGEPPKRGLKVNSFRDSSDDHLMELGEPFLIAPSEPRVHRVPLVRLLGPGRYWRSDEGLGFDIVGEGVDLWANDFEMRLVLDERRGGVCVGKWFSRWCRDGEYGSKPIMTLEPISSEAYADALLRIRDVVV